MGEKYEAFISEITVTNKAGRIATLKQFDGDSFSVELESSILEPSDLKAISSALENTKHHFVNFVTNEKFEKE